MFTFMWDLQLNMGSAVSSAGLLSALLGEEGLELDVFIFLG